MDFVFVVLTVIASWFVLGFIAPILATICCWLERDRQIFTKLLDIMIIPINFGCEVSEKILNKLIEMERKMEER